MPSYQIYKMEKEITLTPNDFIKILDEIKIDESDSEVLKQTIQNLINRHKNIKLETIKKENILEIKFDYELELAGDQKVWIPQKFLMMKSKNYLLIGKSEGNLRNLIEYYFRDSIKITRVFFKNKELWKIWNLLKKSLEIKGISYLLHRIILERTYLDSSLIKEINIHSKNVEDIDRLNDLITNAKKIKVITIKLLLSLEEKKKWSTIRIDHNGNILIYGNQPENILMQIKELITDAI
ncbi:MAG: hypothetical protein ACFFDF_09880 [Candidatus Odinarchaeota archaeon]